MPVFKAGQNNFNFNIKTMLRAPGKIFRPGPNKTLAASEKSATKWYQNKTILFYKFEKKIKQNYLLVADTNSTELYFKNATKKCKKCSTPFAFLAELRPLGNTVGHKEVKFFQPLWIICIETWSHRWRRRHRPRRSPSCRPCSPSPPGPPGRSTSRGTACNKAGCVVSVDHSYGL